MKAEELMIGDWVHYSPKKHIVQVVGISGIQYSFNQQDVILYGDCFKDIDGRGCWESHTTKSLSPIPLTPEILEKNGFVANKHVYPYPYYEYEVKEIKVKVGFAFPQGNRTSYKEPWVCVDAECVYIEHLPCMFVHQLQQAMRLCRIKKEIVL